MNKISTLLEKWSKVDCYKYFDNFTKNIIEKTWAQPSETTCQAIVVPFLEKILINDSDKRKILIEKSIDKFSEKIVIDLLKINNISTSQMADFGALKKFYLANPNQFLKLFGITLENNEDCNLISINNIFVSYPVREYQLKCCQELWALKNNEQTKALLHLPTGAGKTRTAMNFICDYLRLNQNRIVMWFADTVELCEQAQHEFERAWSCLGNRELSYYAKFGQNNASLSGVQEGFIIAGLQKYRSDNQSDIQRENAKIIQQIMGTIKARTGLIVFDEAHKALATTYDQIIKDVMSSAVDDCFLLGLSATPGRNMSGDSNNENQKLSELFGKNKVAMEIDNFQSPLEYLKEHQFLAKYHIYPIDYDHSEINFERYATKNENQEFFNILAENEKRNAVILDKIIELASQPHPEADVSNNKQNQIIVFACNVNHAKELEILVNHAGIKAQAILGNTDKLEREMAIKRYKKQEIQVLVNYDVLTAGFDAPCTNIVLITRPTSSLIAYLQMAGRAMRGPASQGNKECFIYTVNDEIDEFKNMFRAFEYWNKNWRE